MYFIVLDYFQTGIICLVIQKYDILLYLLKSIWNNVDFSSLYISKLGEKEKRKIVTFNFNYIVRCVNYAPRDKWLGNLS